MLILGVLVQQCQGQTAQTALSWNRSKSLLSGALGCSSWEKAKERGWGGEKGYW